jgi:hypothetical protein
MAFPACPNWHRPPDIAALTPPLIHGLQTVSCQNTMLQYGALATQMLLPIEGKRGAEEKAAKPERSTDMDQ